MSSKPQGHRARNRDLRSGVRKNLIEAKARIKMRIEAGGARDNYNVNPPDPI
jgi:hypothetical protein